ncbi:MAG: cell division protein FtsA [Candidatus Binatota bacterium]|nr:cell division protein FtsA [Candidatus Binatota bacterium]
MAKRSSLIVGLDIGTYKVAAVVAEVGDSGVEIIGIGTAASRGLRKGVVVNIDATVESIRKAIAEAELMAGCEIHSVYAGIAGAHVKGFNSHGVVAVKSGEVMSGDVERVLDAARAVALPMDRQIVHVLPQEFLVDDQDGIREPIGMSGVRLESKVHIITASVTSTQNVVKCCQRSGLGVAGVVLEPLASAEAVATPEERELGVALIDIGGGTTDLVVFHSGAVKHTAVLPVGGNHLTNDIATGLRTPFAEAEKVKQRFGCALSSMVSRDESIEVPSIGMRGPRVLSRQILAEIIEPRIEEIFTLVGREITRAGFEDVLASGVVVTGGTTILEGVPELAEQVFHVPVRRGVPLQVGGLVDVISSPMYATGVGLILYGLRQSSNGIPRNGHLWGRVRQRMGELLREIF